MSPERYNLLYFFNELIKLGIKYTGRPGWGNPCSHLIEALILKQENFIGKITGDYTNNSNEYRLNGAGLKMYWEVRRENKMLTDHPDDNCGPVDTAKFVCSIGGDQANDYPEFVEAARKFIKERGCAKWRE